MVHIGAIVASQISCLKLPFTRHLSELRMPDAQRVWVGMGTAAGVAAAFQAPIGGVLYAFEEVRAATAMAQAARSHLLSGLNSSNTPPALPSICPRRFARTGRAF